MSQTITVIPGDGIGPEVTDATLTVLKAAGADLEYDMQQAGLIALQEQRNPLPQSTLDSAEEHRIMLKGPLTTPSGSGFRSINVEMRKAFDLYSNVRPVRTLVPGGRYEDIDLVLIRENTEGLYVGVEHYIGMHGDPRAAAESVMIITRFGAERICRCAFEYARANGRKKVTLAHKANILKYTQGLFLDIGREVAKEYPDIEFEDRIIDATAMLLVLDPYQFDVLVMENMFGDILSDLMAGLVGGLGFAPAGNIGTDAAMFEAVHGSAPDIAGQGVANPTGLLMSACMLLDHVEQEDVATRIRAAVDHVIMGETHRTVDMGGNAGTKQYTEALVRALS
ncbi:MAG: NAD-dependent isocitrate dehydrogenase [Gemmatimonadales bacterium]|jgi:isocitrate dehydrogenase (NAD+)|nr:NAD-dependent isocitrate dehydrogenase [Gemmatimonadales bacterium]MDG2239329.1 isocitrate/isopropylmalate family dehydrogenase [Longimicrobiales bacterium]NCG33724.1 NAD-dependent isocitrate dehydrogenase [Pseudomonadota bacterium]MBT3773983.1 NAD-dependent isocitrate dehydrogenase [Gemmatimonadales bacterium]MBT3957712.1 NAD-dependent isocitrate dehydrogenase [Gemmatimonadales bacterium]